MQNSLIYDFGVLSDVFTEEICSVCKICGDNPAAIKPYFCMSIYGNHPMRFLKILKSVIESFALDSNMTLQFRSLRGMSGLFCHRDVCPHYNKKSCSELDTRISCYRIFSSQRGVEITEARRRLLVNLYGDIDFNKMAGEFFDTIDLSKIPKKRRKKVTKAVGKIRKRVAARTGHSTYRGRYQKNGTKYKNVKRKKSKPVTTTFFHNDNDPEWENLIDEYLAK